MRHRYFLLLLSLLPLALRAQQPFERLGVRVPVLSLTNGRYPEFFDNDSLRRIGSVVYNTRLQRIAYLLPADSLTGHAPAEVSSRWMVVDPLAMKDNFISPYAFCRDNAIRWNDPDGRQVIDGKGNVVTITKQKDENGKVTGLGYEFAKGTDQATKDQFNANGKKLLDPLVGTKSGLKQLDKAINTKNNLRFSLVKGDNPHDKGKIGWTEPAFKKGADGKLQIDHSKPIEISVYQKPASEAASGNGNLQDMVPLKQIYAEVTGHEIEHTTAENQAIKNQSLRSGTYNPAIETKPVQVGDQIRQDYENR